jgi:hypothetical protein
MLVERLNSVRRTGEGRWVARCPSHDDRRPSLSVRELDDGRVLLHCFAGCNIHEVLTATGLTINDLFPERSASDSIRHEARPFNAIDVLRCVVSESLLVAVSAANLAQGAVLTDADRERLMVAASRLQRAAEVARA